jgi:hypothetical protein
MMHLNQNDYNNILSLQSHKRDVDQHDLTAGSAAEVNSEYFHTMYNNNRVNDAGAFLMSSPHKLYSKFPNQQDDQYPYPTPYGPVCASTIYTAAATSPMLPNPTAGIMAYRDLFSMVADESKPFVAKGTVRESFPIKLFKMLEHIDLHEPELANIVSWQPDGRSFLVHGDTKKMEEHILPRFFKGQKQYASFRRQLNLWGFRRINEKGANNGAYYHDMCIRGKPHLCRDISLMAQTRGSKRKEPRYDSTWGNVEEVESRINTHPALSTASKSVVPGAAERVSETSNSPSSSLSSSLPWTSRLSEEVGDQSQATSNFFILKNQYSAVDLEHFSRSPPRMTEDQTYRDLCSMVADESKPFVAKGSARESFPVKLFKMLEHIDLHEPELANIVSWQPDGRSFLIHGDTKKMEEHILPRFFKGQKQYASFRRQLNLRGFRRLNRMGAANGAYYHDMFIRGKPHLCRDISLMARAQSSSSNDSPRYDSTWGDVEGVKPRLNALVPGAAERVSETSNSLSSSLSCSGPRTSWLSEEEGDMTTAFDQLQADPNFFTLKNQYSGVDLEPFSGCPPQMTQDETHNMLDFLGKISRL